MDYARNGQQGPRSRTDRMIFKIIAFLAAAIPIFLFVRSIFFRRTTRINEASLNRAKQLEFSSQQAASARDSTSDCSGRGHVAPSPKKRWRVFSGGSTGGPHLIFTTALS